MIKPTIDFLNFRKSDIYYQISKQYQYDKQTKSFRYVRLVLIINELCGFQEGKYIQDVMECTELKQYLTDD
jgi:hypothetical protein